MQRDAFRKAVAMGARLRRKFGLLAGDAACPVDTAHELGVEVRFMALASLEGMYAREPVPVIVLSSLRPGVRQVFNCAHELGHHLLGDVRCISEVIGEHQTSWARRLRELAADSFAGEFLMAKSAILLATKRRHLAAGTCTPVDVFRLASDFGVGYETLIQQMMVGQLLSKDYGRQLLRRTPGEIKRMLLGWHEPNEVVMMDENFRRKCIHMQVGDVLVVPGSWNGIPACLEPVTQSSNETMLRAIGPDVARLSERFPWSTTLHVAKRGYVGSGRYRYLAEVVECS